MKKNFKSWIWLISNCALSYFLFGMKGLQFNDEMFWFTYWHRAFARYLIRVNDQCISFSFPELNIDAKVTKLIDWEFRISQNENQLMMCKFSEFHRGYNSLSSWTSNVASVYWQLHTRSSPAGCLFLPLPSFHQWLTFAHWI